MRKCLILPVVAALALSVTACDPLNDAAEASHTPAPTTTPVENVVDPDDLFLAVIGDEIPGAGAAHVKVAKAACEALDDGATLPQLILVGLDTDSGLEPEQLGFLLGAGIVAYCPEHQDLIPESGDPA